MGWEINRPFTGVTRNQSISSPAEEQHMDKKKIRSLSTICRAVNCFVFSRLNAGIPFVCTSSDPRSWMCKSS